MTARQYGRLVSVDPYAPDTYYKRYRIVRTIAGDFIVSRDGTRICTVATLEAARAAIDEVAE